MKDNNFTEQKRAKLARIIANVGNPLEYKFVKFYRHSELTISDASKQPLINGCILTNGKQTIFVGKGEVKEYFTSANLTSAKVVNGRSAIFELIESDNAKEQKAKDIKALKNSIK